MSCKPLATALLIDHLLLQESLRLAVATIKRMKNGEPADSAKVIGLLTTKLAAARVFAEAAWKALYSKKETKTARQNWSKTAAATTDTDHISELDLERYYLGMVTAEAERVPLKDHISACGSCTERAEAVQDFVDMLRVALLNYSNLEVAPRMKTKLARRRMAVKGPELHDV